MSTPTLTNFVKKAKSNDSPRPWWNVFSLFGTSPSTNSNTPNNKSNTQQSEKPQYDPEIHDLLIGISKQLEVLFSDMREQAIREKKFEKQQKKETNNQNKQRKQMVQSLERIQELLTRVQETMKDNPEQRAMVFQMIQQKLQKNRNWFQNTNVNELLSNVNQAISTNKQPQPSAFQPNHLNTEPSFSTNSLNINTNKKNNNKKSNNANKIINTNNTINTNKKNNNKKNNRKNENQIPLEGPSFSSVNAISNQLPMNTPSMSNNTSIPPITNMPSNRNNSNSTMSVYSNVNASNQTIQNLQSTNNNQTLNHNTTPNINHKNNTPSNYQPFSFATLENQPASDAYNTKTITITQTKNKPECGDISPNRQAEIDEVYMELMKLPVYFDVGDDTVGAILQEVPNRDMRTVPMTELPGNVASLSNEDKLGYVKEYLVSVIRKVSQLQKHRNLGTKCSRKKLQRMRKGLHQLIRKTDDALQTMQGTQPSTLM